MPSRSFVFGLFAVALAGGIFYATQPKDIGNNRFDPSVLTQTLFTSPISSYDNASYTRSYKGDLKVLVVLTQDGDVTMKNGKIFASGNHPVETLIPMLHLKAAGFDFEFSTATGKPAVFEMWAFPKEDKTVTALYDTLSPQFQKPQKLKDIDVSLKKYAAIFIPGGHGALNDLPTDANLGALLRSAHNQSLPTITLCHGPAALLAAQVGARTEEPFIYKGYTTAVFPDTIDNFTPYLGYLPGSMPWMVQETLEGLGVTTIDSTSSMGQTHRDRELVTGDSPDAANALGVLAANTLLDKYNLEE